MDDRRDLEIAQLRELVLELNQQTSRNEREKQNMRNIRGKLDTQLEIFSQIHQFSQRAFHAKDAKELFEILSEGIVDIFQLEVGAVFGVDIDGETLLLRASCNLDTQETTFPIPRQWLARRQLLDFRSQEALTESPVAGPPFEQLGFEHVVYVPFFDNNRTMIGLMLGGITKASAGFYDFIPEELGSSYLVYCQQMYGIYNNISALTQARSAGEAKTRFLANLSHEIRTPMNAIIGMAQIAERSGDFDQVKRCVRQIDTSSRHLLGLLNDVLDLSKIEEGKLSLDSQPFSLGEVTQNIASGIEPTAAAKQQQFIVDLHGAQDLALVGDALRLSQVLINLLSNAVKFTHEKGTVRLDIQELSSDHEKALLRFAVEDTGIGISSDAAKRIFSPFEQADSSTSRKYGGTGLGLAISQRIVELMGSRIKLESVEGKGSKFYFSAWFPLDAATQAIGVQDAADSYDFTGKRILVVDDVEINREIIYAFLEDTGAVYEGAENGEEALLLFTASAPGYFDLILMDVQMPVMDGCDATRAIRALPRPDAKTITILAMTANVMKQDMQAVADAGMNGHIGKPVEYASTLRILARAFKQKDK